VAGTSVALLAAFLLPAAPASADDQTPAAGTVAVYFRWSRVYGGGYASTPALTNKPVTAQFAFARWWSDGALKGLPVTARVQRRVAGGNWSNTAQTVTTSGYIFQVTMPAYSKSTSAKNATVYYRLAVADTAIVRGDASPSVKVKYENPRRYTGFRLFMYKAMRKYCTNSTIEITRRTNGYAGFAPVGQYGLYIHPMVSHYSNTNKRAVALHECAHDLQYKNYGGTTAGWWQMTAQAKVIYGTNHGRPVEHMADCVSQKANPGGYLGYGGKCTAKQLRYAARILAGKRLF
jgi:hypothetical protein